MTLQCMKKRPDEDYREYAVRWKNVASMVRPSLTSREENSMFVDTLPSLYNDMLIVNTFMEFGDLMYSVGRIEDGIKKGRIMDTRASKEGRKRFVPDEHVQARSGEKKRSHTTWERPVKNHSRSPRYAQVPFAGLQSPKRFAQDYDQGSDPSYYQSKKRKRTKVYHLLPKLFSQGPRDLHIQRSTMSMLNVNTMEELGGTPWRIAQLSKTRFNC